MRVFVDLSYSSDIVCTLVEVCTLIFEEIYTILTGIVHTTYIKLNKV